MGLGNQSLESVEKAWSPPSSTCRSDLGTHLERWACRRVGCVPWIKGLLGEAVV